MAVAIYVIVELHDRTIIQFSMTWNDYENVKMTYHYNNYVKKRWHNVKMTQGINDSVKITRQNYI